MTTKETCSFQEVFQGCKCNTKSSFQEERKFRFCNKDNGLQAQSQNSGSDETEKTQSGFFMTTKSIIPPHFSGEKSPRATLPDRRTVWLQALSIWETKSEAIFRIFL